MNVNNKRASFDALYFDSFGVKQRKKIKSSQQTEISQLFIEYKYMIRQCLHIFVLDLSILC